LDILIIKPSSLGDIIHGLQVAQSLKAQQPDTRITWVAREIFAPLVEACACVDEVIVFHRKAGWAGLRQCIREIRARRYDWVWDMQGLARSGLMTWRARAGRKPVAATTAKARAWLTNSCRSCRRMGRLRTPRRFC
jgi:ADP-heptose:LPS heptosyltransferase